MPPRYWFPAKTHGWGWGLPATWEGWLVLAAYIALVVAATTAISPKDAPASFGASLTVLTAVFIGICWLKGEPPGWRWGE
jgi:hypothetical protein